MAAGLVQPFYTLAELAALLGMSRFAAHRLVRRMELPSSYRRGGKRRIWLADLQTAAPELWESLVLAETARRGATDDCDAA